MIRAASPIAGFTFLLEIVPAILTMMSETQANLLQLDQRPSEGGEAPAWIWPRAAYVHVPFCAHHCGYCDFAVVTGQDGLISVYLDALEMELAALGEPQPVHSVFVGGGTPTHLDAHHLGRLLASIRRWLPARPPAFEFTVEANPGTLTKEKVDVLADHGVNRISLGAQSFHPSLLQRLERDHAPADVARSIDFIRPRIAQVSVDLIFAIPGESLAEWDRDLRQAIDLGPDHISTYGLTYEKGTRLWKQRRLGEIHALCEESELAMYVHGLDALAESGCAQYEISSHARPGRRCHHNQVYWANEAYFGFGMGATRYVNGRRATNSRNLKTYLRRVHAGEPATFQSEALSDEDRARETLALNLRRTDGVNRSQFLWQTGFDLDNLARTVIDHHLELGLLREDDVGVRLTRQGTYVADTVLQSFLRPSGVRPCKGICQASG
jgi:oxygen-independent coproporphyrinogen-3 oxidase